MENKEEATIASIWAKSAVALALATTVWLSGHRGMGHDWGDDYGVYIQHAINIASWHSPTYLTTGNPPPVGLPLIIAATSPLHGWNIVSMKLIGTVAIGLTGIFAFLLARRRVSPVASLAIAAASLWNGWEFYLNQSVGADLPFTAATTACVLITCVALAPEPMAPRLRTTCLVAAPILMLLAMLIKPAGIALAAAVLVSMIFAAAAEPRGPSRNRYLYAVCFALSVVGAYYAVASDSSAGFSQQASGYLAKYSGPLAALAGLIQVGVPREFENLRLLVFWFGGSATLTGVVLGCAICAWGVNLLARRGVAPIEWFASSHVALIVLTPWSDGGPRYLLPALPILYILLASFIEQAVAILVERFGQPALSALLVPGLGFRGLVAAVPIGLIALHSAQTTYAMQDRDDNEIVRPVVSEFVSWLKSHTSPGDTVCSFKPRAVMYLIQRRTCYVGNWSAQQTALQFIESQKARYFVLMTRAQNNPDPALPERIRSDHSLCERFSNVEYAIYGPCDAHGQ